MELSRIFPLRLREALAPCLGEQDLGRTNSKRAADNGVEEIRVRVGQPVELIYDNGVKRLEGATTVIGREDIAEMLNYISSYSLYAYREEMRQGFVTIDGGHRVGMAGHVAMDGQRVTGITPVTFLNIRVAHEKKGCAARVLPYLYRDGAVCHTLLFSTFLRDLVRSISDGQGQDMGQKVGLVDERSEIAACEKGWPQNDVGSRTDVLDGCGKPAGIELMLRVMSPQVIAVDELGTKEDFAAVRAAAVSGCKVIATAHGGTMDELEEKQYLHQRVFERFVRLFKTADGSRGYEVFDQDKRCIGRYGGK